MKTKTISSKTIFAFLNQFEKMNGKKPSLQDLMTQFDFDLKQALRRLNLLERKSLSSKTIFKKEIKVKIKSKTVKQLKPKHLIVTSLVKLKDFDKEEIMFNKLPVGEKYLFLVFKGFSAEKIKQDFGLKRIPSIEEVFYK